MPIDASIYNNVAAQPSVTDQLAGVQKVQIQGQQIQQNQAAVDAQKALDQAYAGAVKVGPDGQPQVDENALFSHLPGHMIPGAMESLAKSKKAIADYQEQQLKVQSARNDLGGSLANTVKSAGYDAPTFLRAVKGLQSLGAIDAPTAAQYAQAAVDGGQPAIQRITDMVIAQSNKQQEIGNATTTANARAAEAAKPTPSTLEVAGAKGDPVALKALELRNAAARGPALGSEADFIARYAKDNNLDPATMTSAQMGAALQKYRESKTDTGVGGGDAWNASKFPDAPAGEKNTEYLNNLPANIQRQVKMLAEGKLNVPAFALRTPYWQDLLQATAKYDPTFDTVNYNARNKTRADFTSGASAKQVNAINTAIGHLDGLSSAADALGNFHEDSLGPLTGPANSLANYVSLKRGSPKVTNFNTIQKAVSDEVTRVWRQAGGSEQDVQTARANLDAANTPEQLHGAIATYATLLESKLASLNNQYKQGMGTDNINIVTPSARATLSRLEQKAGKPEGAITGDLPAAAQGDSVQRAIPGIPGAIAESTDGGKTWKRIK